MTDRFIHSSQGYLSEVEDHGIEATKFDEHIYHIMLQSGRMYNAESNRWFPTVTNLIGFYLKKMKNSQV